jgi:hypothetical protein
MQLSDKVKDDHYMEVTIREVSAQKILVLFVHLTYIRNSIGRRAFKAMYRGNNYSIFE